MISPVLRTLTVGLLGLFAYSAALACSCADASWSAGDVAVSGEVGRRSGGCGATNVQRKLTIIEVHQDPSGTLAVGDTLMVQFNQASGAACGVDVAAGDEVTVWGGDPHALQANLCSSRPY